MRLAGKVAVITGAGSGVGRAAAVLFAREGARVVVADVNDGGGQETLASVTAGGGQAIFVHADVAKDADVSKLVQAAVAAYGKLDILYNNAGRYLRKPLEAMSEAEWDQVYGVNVKAIFLGARHAVPHMKRAGGGVIINTASISGVRPRAPASAYASSKGAALTLTNALAMELAPHNIRVCAINPAAVDSPMLRNEVLGGGPGARAMDDLTKAIPLGRLVQPEDVARAALFLASDDASMITGAALNVDGGRGV